MRSVSRWVRATCAVVVFLIALAPTSVLAADEGSDEPSIWSIIASWFGDDQSRIRVPAGED